MKRFRFALDPLLLVKKRKEEDRILELSKIASEINSYKEIIQSSERKILEAQGRIQSLFSGSGNLADYFYFEEYIKRLNLQIEIQNGNIQNKETELNEARIRLMEARKDKKVLETLRDKRLLLHKKKRIKMEKQEEAEYWEQKNYRDSQTPKIQTVKTSKRFKLLQKPESEEDENQDNFTKLRDFYKKHYQS